MEWLKELLKDLENADELQKAIAKGIGENFVAKADFNTVNETKKKLEGDIATRDKQLEDLKKIDVEDLQNQIETLQEENETSKETYEKELKDLQLSNAIKLAINGKVHDEDLVAGLVDKEKVVIDDGKIIGLDEQIQSLQESKSFLFKEEKQEGEQQQQNGFQKIGNEPPNNVQAMDDAIAAAFGNTEE